MNAVYQYVTDRILACLEKGTIPWKKEWKGYPLVPTNLLSKKPYRGVNRFLLDPAVNGFSSPYWLSYKQAQELGGQVKSGAKSQMCVFWTFIKDKNNPLKRPFPFLRYYNVFNLEQTEGIKAPTVPVQTFDPLEACEAIVTGWENPAKILHNGGDSCHYTPATDTISMASRETFTGPEAYYRVLFHEMGHATGHPSRLNRTLTGRMKSDAYAREELIAEMTASNLAEVGGIGDAKIDNSAAYIAHWMKHIRNDPMLIVSCAGAAQKASDLILGTQPIEEKEEPQTVENNA